MADAKEAGLDTKRLREIAELPWFPVPEGITRDVVLSLLDRIEELEKLLTDLEPAIANAIANTWTPEQIRAAMRRLNVPEVFWP